MQLINERLQRGRCGDYAFGYDDCDDGDDDTMMVVVDLFACASSLRRAVGYDWRCRGQLRPIVFCRT